MKKAVMMTLNMKTDKMTRGEPTKKKMNNMRKMINAIEKKMMTSR